VNHFEGHGLAFIWLNGDLFPSNKTFQRLACMADGTNSLSTSALAMMRQLRIAFDGSLRGSP
jgi:hypothetical protein